MLQIKVNKDKTIDYKEEKGKIFINNEIYNLDIEPIGTNKFHVLKDNASFTIEVIEFDPLEKLMKIKIENEIFEVGVKEKLDLLLQKMGMTSSKGTHVNEIKAPMPGLILDIKAFEGTQVEAGDTLLILEAMKMENVIKSPRKGTIKKLKVKKGDSVEKNQILIEFDQA